MKKYKYKILITIYILLLGLIPLLWFSDNNFITGTDVNFSPFPFERLIERTHTWNQNLLAGSDRANNMSSLSYIGTSGLLSLVVNNPVTVEKLTFVIWFTLTGIAMNYLLNGLFSDLSEKRRFYIKIFGILIYMVNFYHVFMWVRLQLAITNLVFLPILFKVMHSVFSKNKLSLKELFWISIATILGGSLGTQPPIMYAIIISMIIYMAFYLSFDFKTPKIIFSKIKKIALVTIVVLVSGSYWIFPLGNFIFQSALVKDANYGRELYNVEQLLGWTSKTTSNLNVFRMYGDVVWFDGWGGELYFPEFVEFYDSRVLTALSVLFVFFIFSSLSFNKNKRKSIIIFGFLALITLFFSKGVHPPFNSIFKLAFNNLPGFWIHRAPWQKFGLITTLCYGVLGGYGIYKIVYYLDEKYKILKVLSSTLIIILYLYFNQLFVFGVMFPNKNSDIGYHGAFNLGFHHTFPDYLYDVRDYILEKDDDYYNIMLLPEQHTSVYNWGYAGSTDLGSIFLKRSTLFSPYGEGFVLDGYISNVYSALVSIIYNESITELTDIFDFYNIRYILQRNDFTYDFYGDYDSPEFIKKALSKLNVHDPITFGEWDLYNVKSENVLPMVYSATYTVDVSDLHENILIPRLNNQAVNYVLMDNVNFDVNYNEAYLSTKGKYVKTVEYDADYDLDDVPVPNTQVSPNSPIYPLLRIKEQRELNKLKDTVTKADNIIWLAFKRLQETVAYPELTESKRQDILNDYYENIMEYSRIIDDENSNLTSRDRYDLALKGNSYLIKHLSDDIYKSVLKDDLRSKVLKQSEHFLQIKEEFTTQICLEYCNDVEIEHSGTYEYFLKEPSYRDIDEDIYEMSYTNIENGFNKEETIKTDTTTIDLDSGEYLFNLQGPKYQVAKKTREETLSEEEFINDVINPKYKFSNKLLPEYKLSNITKHVYENLDFLTEYEMEILFDVHNGSSGLIVAEENYEGEIQIIYSPDVHEPIIDNEVETMSSEDFIKECEDVTDLKLCLESFDLNFTTHSGIKSLFVYTYSYTNTNNEIVPSLYINNINLQKIVVPNIVFKSVLNADAIRPPKLKYYRVNPTKYIIEIEDGYNDNFNLVVNQTFSPHWRAYIGNATIPEGSSTTEYLGGAVVKVAGDTNQHRDPNPLETWTMREIPQEKHFKSNHFGNGWNIDGSDINENEYIVVEFIPQRIFYVSVILTLSMPIIILVIMLGKLIINFWRARNRKYEL